MMEEIWKDVLGYEGHYKVSSLGRIKSSKKKPFCSEDDVNQFISFVFVNETSLDGKINLYLTKGTGDVEKIKKLFHLFYSISTEHYEEKKVSEKYKRILYENFEGFTVEQLNNNFKPKASKFVSVL